MTWICASLMWGRIRYLVILRDEPYLTGSRFVENGHAWPALNWHQGGPGKQGGGDSARRENGITYKQ